VLLRGGAGLINFMQCVDCVTPYIYSNKNKMTYLYLGMSFGSCMLRAVLGCNLLY
jgi:hypothetical protein